MKIVQIVPRQELRLYAALVPKDADIRTRVLGTFYRAAAKKPNSTKWRHKAYRGWINLERGLFEVVLGEIHGSASEQEGQILSAFLGFVDRHFENGILAITIHDR